MRIRLLIFFLLAGQFAVATFTALAHPGTGIVVNDKGEVFFTHSGRGVGKIDAHGKLSYIFDSKGGHWMCLDWQGTFSRTQPKYFERVTPGGVKPAVIFADGGGPNDGWRPCVRKVSGDGNVMTLVTIEQEVGR